jgi:serine/threonine protein phosphatase PrpC
MGVLCPECGSTSHDPEFCDRCNTDLRFPAAPAATSADPGPPVHLLEEQAARLSRPEAAVLVGAGDQTWRCHRISTDAWPSWQARVEERLRHRAGCLPPGHLVHGEGATWVVIEAAGERLTPWTAWPGPDLLAGLESLAAFADRLAASLEELHAAGLVWLDFDPLALNDGDGRLRFTNLDLTVYPTGHLPTPSPCRPSFLAPEVARGCAEEVGPRTDVFHLALFVYYAIGRFLPHGFFGAGLPAFDFELPPLRVFEPRLPVGLAPVVHHGLAVDPARRPATPSAWCAEFRAALERALVRERSDAAIAWDTGFHSRTGQTKAALGWPNEDAGFVRHFTDPDRTAVVIADGVSSCDIGSGATASRITCDRLDACLGAGVRARDFFLAAGLACELASGDILDWALEHGDPDRLVSGADVMGTTALAAWLEGRTLQVANVGDSRVYLIDESGIDQLTVDGDLGNALLAAGVPPEVLKDLGSAARSLYSYVGGCARDSSGKPLAGEHGVATRSQYPLLPSDTVVLCSDGLVEEGAFLEPEDLLRLVRAHAGLSAQALTERLAEEADARQLLPSETEPTGRGDNITCCVIRVRQRE